MSTRRNFFDNDSRDLTSTTSRCFFDDVVHYFSDQSPLSGRDLSSGWLTWERGLEVTWQLLTNHSLGSEPAFFTTYWLPSEETLLPLHLLCDAITQHCQTIRADIEYNMSTIYCMYMVCQVDFHELMMKKRDVIESEPQLFDMIGKPAGPVACSDEVRNCIGRYWLTMFSATALLLLFCYWDELL